MTLSSLGGPIQAASERAGGSTTADEFTGSRCFLVHHRSQLTERGGRATDTQRRVDLLTQDAPGGRVPTGSVPAAIGAAAETTKPPPAYGWRFRSYTFVCGIAQLTTTAIIGRTPRRTGARPGGLGYPSGLDSPGLRRERGDVPGLGGLG
jgi:hypothetical protein